GCRSSGCWSLRSNCRRRWRPSLCCWRRERLHGLDNWRAQTDRLPEFYQLTTGGALLSVIPLAILILVLQRFWRGGLTESSVKGWPAPGAPRGLDTGARPSVCPRCHAPPRVTVLCAVVPEPAPQRTKPWP